MALRNIVKDGDEILRKKARVVDQVDDRIRLILDDMIDTMREQSGVGIAAPQIGILKRMFVVEAEGQLIELINPEIIEQEGLQMEQEGCLSVPGFIGTVERPTYVKMKGKDRNGQDVTYEGRDFLAIVMSHENDHLDGILYTDKALDITNLSEED